jgi:peroxin-19
VLDQFSANAPTSTQPESSTKAASQPSPTASGPGRPQEQDFTVPDAQRAGESDEEFMKRLTAELSSAMSQMSAAGPEDPNKASPEELAKMDKELEQFTLAMEKEGIQPEDLLKAILGEEEGSRLAAAAEEDAAKSASSPSASRTAFPQATSSKPTASNTSSTSFEDTIRRTMERMETSSTNATSASQKKATSEEDMLADILKSLGSGDGSDANPDELSNMFLSMMQQLTNKGMLYEPMKELDDKFPQWIKSNKSKLKPEDVSRYTKQQQIVQQIVSKFEEKSYSDDDPKCRDFIWEKMQAMQEQGAPPEELVQNPLPGMGGLGDLTKGDGPDEGCPTQ